MDVSCSYQKGVYCQIPCSVQYIGVSQIKTSMVQAKVVLILGFLEQYDTGV